jgi:nicotinamide mononucleotide adenylyltransferase
MIINSSMLRNMMRSYDQQIGSGQRIERVKKYLTPLSQTGDTVSISKDARRNELVERVSHEIIDNLLGSESSNPVVQEIKQQINEEFSSELLFSYPMDGSGLQIFERHSEGTTQLTDGDRDKVLARIKKITQEKVDKTMV